MTETEKIQLVELRAEMRSGFTRMDEKFAASSKQIEALDKRTQWLDKDGDELRHEVFGLRAESDGKPCEQHAEEIKRLREKISREFKHVHKEETTGKIDIARLEAAQKANEAVLAKIEQATREATSISDRKWKRFLQVASMVVALAGGIGGYKCSVEGTKDDKLAQNIESIQKTLTNDGGANAH